MSCDNLYRLFEQCDRWRTRHTNGETQWQEMMQNSIPLGEAKHDALEALEKMVDLESLMDEDENIHSFCSADPDAMAYQSNIQGVTVYFLQYAGFEFIFTENGSDPDELI